jgi:hypothetical protein
MSVAGQAHIQLKAHTYSVNGICFFQTISSPKKLEVKLCMFTFSAYPANYTNSIKHIPSWEADNRSASLGISLLL